MDNLLIYSALILVLGFLASKIKRSGVHKEKFQYSYSKHPTVMTFNERELFSTLLSIVGNEYYVFPQIHLSTIINHRIKGQNWKGAFSHINGKSVDFLLSDKRNLSPVLAIELDDSSHNKEDRIDRDKEVERILAETNIPLLRISSQNRRNIEEIKNKVCEILDS